MYNHVHLLGNLGKDPELRYTPQGTAVCSMSVITNHKYKDKQDTFFGDVVVYGATAEACSKYLTKGSQCMVSGRLNTRSCESDGQRRCKVEIIADTVKFLGSKRKEETTADTQGDFVPPEETDLEPF